MRPVLVCADDFLWELASPATLTGTAPLYVVEDPALRRRIARSGGDAVAGDLEEAAVYRRALRSGQDPVLVSVPAARLPRVLAAIRSVAAAAPVLVLSDEPIDIADSEGVTTVSMAAFAVRVLVPELERAALRDGRERLRAWSAGCASGEEAYTVALLWPAMDVLATDMHPAVLDRARRAAYPSSSLRELTASERERGFTASGGEHVVRPEVAARVTIAGHDLRDPSPDGPFDLVLCRNVAFTYLDDAAQRAVLDRLARALRPGGALVTGLHEAPPASRAFAPWPGARAVHRRTARPAGAG
jgi:SAM-dependent methyltransferase